MATAMKKPAKTKPEETPLFDKAEQDNELTRIKDLIEAGELLEETCYAVDLEVNWFTASAQAKGGVVDEMADVAEADKDSFSIPVKLFSSKHPLVEKCEAAKRLLYAFRDQHTWPLAKIQAFLSTDKDKGVLLATKKGAGGKKTVAKDAGIRCISIEKLDDFVTQLQEVYGPAVITAVQQLNAQMDEVLMFEEKRQGRLFRKENYPKEINASIRMMPRRLGLGVDFEKHCPKAAALLLATKDAQLSDTVELAVAELVNTLFNYVKVVTNQLGYRTRLAPTTRHPVYGHLQDAEVVSITTSKENPDVAEDSLILEVRYVPKGEKKAKVEELEITEAQYKELRPYQTEERKKVVETTLDGMLYQIERIANLAKPLGKPGQRLKGIADEVREVFHTAGGNKAEMLKEMRDSSFFRKAACKSLAGVQEKLQDMVITMPAYKQQRRSVGRIKDAED